MDESKNSSELPKLLNAYFIAGHGRELLNDTFIVPPGCTIVINMHMLARQYSNTMRNITTGLAKLNIDKIKQPVKYSTDIFKSTGTTFEIYTEGQECPNLEYLLISDLNKKIDNICFFAYSSGIYNIENKKALELLYNSGTVTYPSDSKVENSEELSTYLYRDSVFPTQKQLNDALMENLAIQSMTYKMVFDILKFKDTVISQKDLCIKLPGVYYSSVCRFDPILTDKLYNHIQNNTTLHRNVLKNTASNIVPSYFRNKTRTKAIDRKENEKIYRIITKNMIQTMKHRTPYIRNMYTTTNKKENNEFYNISYTNKNLRVAKIEEAISTLKHDIKNIEEMIEKQTGIKSPIPGRLKYILSEKFRVLHKDKLLALKRIDIIDKNRKHKEKKSILSYIDNIGIKRKKILEYIDTLDKEKQSIVNTLELIETLDKSLKYKQILLEKYRQ